ncbi:Outer membrane protein beta-barrel domain-containing protein [Sinomicrobium oceani]|uniref:Outer membrane protein beta-barrel domain-containing protein n=1 Tax=Sinomicrobium oceani TaxID=1150368 RepID=A0A1K1N2E4_9FLAO|nr:outer membrane beta-barrel protein [Sinomicrobium oceani]SFW29604.1 Outer membrane protein beta-barrel domain-containing protein [Sinomicrobium oceani]
MGDKKNIDRLFQEKFKDFEAFPEKDLWSGIEAKLNAPSTLPAEAPKKDGRTIPFFWWRLGGIAATIALLLSIGFNLVFTDPESPDMDPLEKITREHPEQKTRPGDEATRSAEEYISNPDNNTREEKEKSNPVTTTERFTASPDTSDNTAGTTLQNNNSQAKAGNTKTQQYSTSKNETGIAVRQTTPSHHTQENEKLVENGNPTTQHNPDNSTSGQVIASQKSTVAEHPNHVTGQNNNTISVAEKEQKDIRNKEEENKKSLLEAIAEMENEAEREKELASGDGEHKKWSLNPNIAPVYYNSISSGSPIDPEFKSNSKSGKVNLSYGVNVAYQVNDRLSLRSGINKVNYGYDTNDISFAPNFEARSLSNINYARQSERASGLYVANSPADPAMPGKQEVTTSLAPQEGAMQQEFGYIEVPMELKYRILNERFGLNLIGGVSSLFLTDNTILLKSDAIATELGEANNVNNVNFSTNVGLGVDYLLSDKLQLQLEPMFKYQWNTFSNDNGGFRPYTFGVYTGFSFRF